MRSSRGIFIIGVLAAVTTVLWWLAGNHLWSLAGVERSLGQVAGLLSLVFFCLSFVLSLRNWRQLEDLFGGVNHMYQTHHLLGVLAFTLMNVHPVLLSLRFLPDRPDIAAHLLLPNRLPATLGWLAIGLVTLVVMTSIFRRFRYHIWRGIHFLSGPAFFLMVAHTLLVPSDVTRYQPLYWYILFLSLIGTVAYLIRIWSHFFGVQRFEYTIIGVTHLDPETILVTAAPLAHKIHYRAGQFAYLSFAAPYEPNHESESHPFSFTSTPKDHEVEFVIKALGDGTKLLQKLVPGALTYLEGPYGRFSFRNTKGRDQIWIAGGIGVTPFLSMARDLRQGDRSKTIHLFYCTDTRDEAFFRKEFQALAKQFPNFHLIFHCAKERGFLSVDQIASNVGQLGSQTILMSGPPAMITNLSNQFQRRKVHERQIFSEEFQYTG